MPRGRPPKREFREHLGRRYYLADNGYYYASASVGTGGARRLHRALWESHNGPLPPGFYVSFVDGDRSNLDLANLQAVPRGEHRRKWPVVEFQGVRYYRKPPGYYKATGAPKDRYLHRDVWEAAHGPIPAGCHVHHIDGDRGNNALGNLELLRTADHLRHHLAQRDPGWWEDGLATARIAAAQWHRDPANHAVHVASGIKSWVGRERRTLTCAHCGGGYLGYVVRNGAGYCTANCRAKARRARGDDDVERECPCGARFRSDRYRGARRCEACRPPPRGAETNRIRPDGG